MTIPLGLSKPELAGCQWVDQRVLQFERDIARAHHRVIQAEQARQAIAAQLEQLKQDKAAEVQRVHQLRDHIEKIYASTSWRVSRPIRAVHTLMRILRRRQMTTVPIVPAHAPVEAAAIQAAPLALGSRGQAMLRRLQGRAQI